MNHWEPIDPFTFQSSFPYLPVIDLSIVPVDDYITYAKQEA